MYTVICTKSRDNADELETQAFDYTLIKDAISLFKERVQKLVDEALNNEFLNVKMSLHKYKALVVIESTHYVVSIVEDGGVMHG